MLSNIFLHPGRSFASLLAAGAACVLLVNSPKQGRWFCCCLPGGKGVARQLRSYTRTGHCTPGAVVFLRLSVGPIGGKQAFIRGPS
jgi:hypothetical protein